MRGQMGSGPSRTRPSVTRAKVSSSAEVLALATQYDGAAVAVGCQPLQGLRNTFDEPDVEVVVRQAGQISIIATRPAVTVMPAPLVMNDRSQLLTRRRYSSLEVAFM